MCQLTLVNTNLGDKTEFVNKTLTMHLMYGNSHFVNKDGCGFFAPDCGIFKTRIAASLLLNLGLNLKLRKTGASPIMAHVRAASTVNKEMVADEFSHPFDSEHFVLAHNGTLVQDDKKSETKVEVKAEEKPAQTPAAQEPPTTPLLEAPKDPATPVAAPETPEVKKSEKKIDSQIFLEELEKHYTGNVVKDVETTMKLFTGKFALMLWHKPEKKYYIFRGSTATLYKFNLVNAEDKIVGFIVNTELTTGELAIREALNQLQLSGITLEAHTGTLLKPDTAYRVDSTDLVEVGHVTEKYPTTAITTTRGNTRFSNLDGWGNYDNIRDASTNARPSDSSITALGNFVVAADLTLWELDELMFATTGKSMLNMTITAYEAFCDFVELTLSPALTKDKIRLWDNILEQATKDEIYSRYPTFKFPFMLNNAEFMNQILKEVSDEKVHRL